MIPRLVPILVFLLGTTACTSEAWTRNLRALLGPVASASALIDDPTLILFRQDGPKSKVDGAPGAVRSADGGSAVGMWVTIWTLRALDDPQPSRLGAAHVALDGSFAVTLVDLPATGYLMLSVGTGPAPRELALRDGPGHKTNGAFRALGGDGRFRRAAAPNVTLGQDRFFAAVPAEDRGAVAECLAQAYGDPTMLPLALPPFRKLAPDADRDPPGGGPAVVLVPVGRPGATLRLLDDEAVYCVEAPSRHVVNVEAACHARLSKVVGLMRPGC